MVGFSPPPPPQAARAFVRQLFRTGGGRPRIVATLLDDPNTHAASLEFLNEGGPANGVECLAEIADRLQHVTVGSLAPGDVTSVALDALGDGEFRCVWACSDEARRTHIWSYDGRHRRLSRRQHLALPDAFRELYPAAGA
jgi:hypothetical protein